MMRTKAKVFFLSEGTVKLRLVVACLLCLLLFMAAIDHVPDPPAVNPHNSETGRISALHVRAPSALQQEIIVSLDSSHFVRTGSSASRQTIENKLLGLCQLLVVRHAADPSPPILS
jgi:hypothetical protein